METADKNLTQLKVLDPYAVQLYNIAKSWTNGNRLTVQSVLSFTTTLMRSIQTIVKEPLQGSRKKELVLSVLKLVIQNDTKMKEEDKHIIEGLLEFVIPGFIDTAVSLATGELDIGKDFMKYLVACSPCIPIKRKKHPVDKDL